MENETLFVTLTGVLLALAGILTLLAQTLNPHHIDLRLLIATEIFLFSGIGLLLTAQIMDYIDRKMRDE